MYPMLWLLAAHHVCVNFVSEPNRCKNVCVFFLSNFAAIFYYQFATEKDDVKLFLILPFTLSANFSDKLLFHSFGLFLCVSSCCCVRCCFLFVFDTFFFLPFLIRIFCFFSCQQISLLYDLFMAEFWFHIRIHFVDGNECRSAEKQSQEICSHINRELRENEGTNVAVNIFVCQSNYSTLCR